MKIMPFYTSTGMRDAESVNSQDALLCPTHKMLPFQIQRVHSSVNYITEAKIVDCDGAEWDILGAFLGAKDVVTDWENGPHPTYSFTTFSDASGNILTAIESGSANSFCYSNAFALATGDAVVVSYNLTLNSGDLPNIYLGEFTGPSLFSKKVLTATGINNILLTATGNTGGNVRLMMENEAGNDTSFACAFSYVQRTTLKIKEFSTYDFITYNGEPFSKEIYLDPLSKYNNIPYGVWYLRLKDNNTTWYSEWFNAQDIQPQLMASYSGGNNYDTFTLSGVNVTSGINLAGTAVAYSNAFTARTGEKFIFTSDLTLNSGVYPSVFLLINSAGGSSTVPLVAGLNEFELTSTKSGSARLSLAASAANNFALSSVSLRRKAGEYVHLEFTNARDFNHGDESIYYAGGFTQQAYLRAYENLPSHETIETGNDKNGDFVAEKMVSKYTRSVVSYESRSMYNALRMLPLHSSVKILTETGVEYTPSVGNINVGIDWNTFDTGSLRIAWNETGHVWTNSMDNIV